MKYYFRENIRRYEQMLDQGFDAWSERLYGGTEYDHFSSRPFLDLILPKLSVPSDDPTALELGTGVGPGAFLLDEHGYRTTGYDLIPEAIVAARENAAAKGRAITFEVMDVTQIPHEGESFDLVVDSYCINHVVFDHERTAVFESVKARLNPRGYYLVTSSVYNPSSHDPERKVTDTSTGKVYDTYGDDALYDPQTDYYYEPLGKFPSKREQTAELQDTFEVNGTTYIPKRCYRDGKRLRAELVAHGFDVLFQHGEFDESLVCVHAGSGVTLADNVEGGSCMADVTTTVSEQIAALVEAGFPTDTGTLDAIFIRPVRDEREELDEAELLQAEGVKGDRWRATTSTRLPDGSPDPRTQITMMNVQVLDCVSAGARDKWGLAGDQLIVDFDVSEENLPVGQRVRVGDAVVEVTDIPHTGCAKFRKRYGAESLDYINAEGREHKRLRGVYVKVIEEATVRPGDTIVKV